MKAWAKQHHDWLLVEQDECWFSRFAQPAMHTFAEINDNLRLVQRTPHHNEPDQAIACFGAVCQRTRQRWLSFADGQPNSDKTIQFVQALLKVAKSQAKRVLVIIWDRASWHKSKTLKQWVHQHNQHVRQHRGVRLLTVLLPSKSPWLNPMEPIWLHTKRKIAEPEAQLSVKLLKERLSALFDTTLVSTSLKPSV